MAATETILLPRATLHVSNLIVEAFRRRGLAPKFSSRCNYPELNKELVRKGLGLAPMPMTLCSPASLEGLVAIPFEEPLTRDLHLIYPQDRPLSAAARALDRLHPDAHAQAEAVRRTSADPATATRHRRHRRRIRGEHRRAARTISA